jgi:putative addiction module CopG family antidote
MGRHDDLESHIMPILQVELDEDEESFIAEQIAQGRYPNVSEVLKAGLASLELSMENDPEWRARLCAAAQIGFDQLDAGQKITLNDDAEIRAFFEQMVQRVIADKVSSAATR